MRGRKIRQAWSGLVQQCRAFCEDMVLWKSVSHACGIPLSLQTECSSQPSLSPVQEQPQLQVMPWWTKPKELNGSGKHHGTTISTCFAVSCLLLCDLDICKYLSSFRSRTEMLRKHGNAYNIKNVSRPILNILGNFFSLQVQKYPLLQVEATKTVLYLSILAYACNLVITNHPVSVKCYQITLKPH